jgi:hypothetical protein
LLEKTDASKEDSKKEEKEVNLAETSSGSRSSMVDEVFSTCDVLNQHHHWLLDSSASIHMCLHRNWFSTYQSIDDGVVLWEMFFLVKLFELVESELKCMMVP